MSAAPDLFAPASPRREAKPSAAAAPQWKVCVVCGARAQFGYGASVLRKTIGRWACLEHRDAVERMSA